MPEKTLLDAVVQAALLEGEVQDEWEVIIKYYGDIRAVAAELEANVDVLTESYAILSLPLERLSDIYQYPEIEYVEMPKRLGQSLQAAVTESCISSVTSRYGFRGEGVILGIIDSGIDYTHPDFILDDGTSRIYAIWDQTIDGNPPAGFSYGSVYTREMINEALKANDIVTQMQIVPSMDTVGHGTHVAGIAGGNGRASQGQNLGVAPEATFIIVKLGARGTRSYPRTTELMRALKYVIDTSRELSMPVSINISYGTNNGAHNGTSIFETYIDEIALRWKSSISVATGNEGIAGHHASGLLSSGGRVEEQFVVADGLPSIEFSIWTSFVDGIGFEIVTPGGIGTGIVVEGNRTFNFIGYQMIVAEGSPSPFTMDRELFVEIIPKSGRMAAGKWTIILHGGQVVDGRYNIWLPITEVVGRETYFLTPDQQTTLTLPSTANSVISVGGYDSRTGSMADFSGKGHNRSSSFFKPDIVAPAVDIIAPIPGGGYGAFSGTSMAAPFVAGAAALMLEWGIVGGNDPFLYGEKLKAYLLRGAGRSNSITYPNAAWGYGRLCLLDSFYALLGTITTIQGRGGEHMMELSGGMREEVPIQQKIISDDYRDLIVFYGPELLRILQRYPEISICQTILDSYVVIQIHKDRLPAFLEEISSISYQQPTLYGLMDQESLVASGIVSIQNQPYLNLRGQGTLFGIIDTGIDYTNNAFIYEDGTSKIVSIWDQTIPGDSPNGFCYGTEFTQEQINAALKLEDPFSLVPHRDEVGHGTFLSTVAAGRGSGNSAGAAPDADIVAVKLKRAKPYLLEEQMILRNEAVAFQDTDIIEGIEYIFNMAREMNRPLALCLPFGTNHSELGGYAVLDQFISSASVLKGLAICVPAGNEGNRGHHYEGILTQNEKMEEVEIDVAPGEKGILVDIWNYVPDKISVGVVSPRGTVIERFPVRDKGRQETKMVFENTTVTIEYFIVESRTGEQRTMVRFLNPTPGIWTIVVYGDMIIDGRFHAWLPITGWLEPGTRFLNPSPDFTVTSPGISHEAITVGAYNVSQSSIYIESGRGPEPYSVIVPDIVAPGVNVTSVYPGNMEGTMTGTSVATAIAAGACLLILEWAFKDLDDNSINTNKIRTYLARGARRRSAPNNVWGYGELDLVSTFEQLG